MSGLTSRTQLGPYHRRRRPQPQPPPQPLPRPRPQPRLQPRPQPQQGSLRSLLLQHSSKRLYVHPLRWGPLHLSILGCIVLNYQVDADACHCRLRGGIWWKHVLELWDRLLRLKVRGPRNKCSRELVQFLGLSAEPKCQIDAGTLTLHYDSKPVCDLCLPLMARYNGTLLWAFIDDCSIEKLHQRYRPRENIWLGREKRHAAKKDTPISPLCVAIILAMAQMVKPGQQVTLFLFDHEYTRGANNLTSAFYEYTSQVSQTYLHKFEHVYTNFESELTIHRRVIPVQGNMFNVLSETLYRATTGHGDQAEVASYNDGEAALPPQPEISTKRKALHQLDDTTSVKRRESRSTGEECSDIV